MLARIPKAEITKILKEGRNSYSPLFSVKFIKNPLNISAFCFIVSKKEGKTAVIRNFIKRRARNIVQKTIKNINLPFKIVFLFKKEASKADFGVLEEQITQTLLSLK